MADKEAIALDEEELAELDMIIIKTGTAIASPGAQGEYLGVLRLEMDGDGKTTKQEWRAIALDAQVADDREMANYIANQRQ